MSGAGLAAEEMLALLSASDAAASFVHFSRLGWLVEYLSELKGEEMSYQGRRRADLAWRFGYCYCARSSSRLT